jgi:putative ABC transport system permease protein
VTLKMLREARFGPKIRPLKQDLVGDVGKVLWVLLGTVGMVLLIACANVANLFLVRAESRQQELAVRLAVGADWKRIGAQLLSESTLLGIAGGACGVLLACGGIRLLIGLGPAELPRLDEIRIDPLVLLFTLAISLLAGLLFGLFPVIKYARPDLVSALKEGGRASSDGRERHRARNALVVAQVALALVLLVGSGLMIRSFQALRRVQPGFSQPTDVLTLRISIPAAEVPDEEVAVRLHEQIQHRIEQIPGVASVGLSSSITMDGHDSNDAVWVEGFPVADGQLPPIRRFKWVSENYFQTMGSPVLAGRSISWADTYHRADVVMVTENFARQYWSAPADAVGKRIRTSDDVWRQIIGVVGDEHDDGVGRPATPVVYWPMLLANFQGEKLIARRTMGYAVRTQRIGSPTLMREVQQAVWSVNPNLPLADVQTLDRILRTSMAQTSFTLVMLAIAAAVALLLGMIGIYGVISYAVSQRTREIGIRMALGAGRQEVSRLFVSQGLVLTGIGLLLGLGAAAGLTRLMSALLFGVSPFDLVTYGAVSVVLACIALMASYIPARRAARVDPLEALRWE